MERKGKRAKKREGIEEQRVKHQTPSSATDALIGDEDQNGKQNRTKRKTGSRSPTQLPRTIQSPPTTCRDHTVSLCMYKRVVGNDKMWTKGLMKVFSGGSAM